MELPLWETEGKFRVSQKRDLGACNDTSLLGSGVELLVIFYTKKKRKRKKEIQITCSKYFECHWLNKEKYNFGKLTLQDFGS